MANPAPSNKNNQEGPSDKKPFGGKNFTWIYLFILALILWQVSYSFFQAKPEEITLSKFKTEMLANQDVEKIAIVNKEKAEVFIKKARADAGHSQQYINCASKEIKEAIKLNPWDKYYHEYLTWILGTFSPSIKGEN